VLDLGIEAAKKEAEELENAMLEALAQTKKAYEFCPGSYTYHAMIAVQHAARALWTNPQISLETPAFSRARAKG
jgi:hypothetical protein